MAPMSDEVEPVVGPDHAAFELGAADERAAPAIALEIAIGDEVGDRAPQRAPADAVVPA
jgi:hypothetical protein